jgi:hypothetical protein
MLDRPRREPTPREEMEAAWLRYREFQINRDRVIKSLCDLEHLVEDYNAAQGSHFNPQGWGK